nr:C1 family peptidase [Bacteroidota bacterium]
MRNSKSNYLIVAALSLLSILTSCKKDSLESIAPSTQNAVEVEATQPPQEETQNAEYNERNTGAVLLPESQYDKLEKVENVNTTLVYPASKYLTCPPIKSQGSEGSCVAFGTAYSARSIAKYYKTGATSYNYSTNVFSPEFIYNQIKVSTCAGGSYVTDALNKMRYALPWYFGQGVCTWNSMPYSSTNGCSTLPNAAQIANANLHRITSYATVNCVTNDIKNQLVQNRAVIVAGPVDTKFQNLAYGATYTSYNSAQKVGNHCYTVIGYSDAKHAFKVMNSWGTNWATSGYAWIDYDVVCTTLPIWPNPVIPTGFWKEAYVITSSL